MKALGDKRRQLSFGVACALLAAAAVSGCGGDTEVWVRLVEDGSRPCLGAAHLHIQVLRTSGMDEFHEYGQFFNLDTHACVVGQYAFGGLPLATGVRVAISVWDSTTDQAGLLATGTSVPIDVQGGAPTTQLDITLARTTVPLGTIVINRPSDWGTMAGIDAMQFIITPLGEAMPLRSGYFSFLPELRPDPFPLMISSMPVPGSPQELTVQVDGLNEARQVMRSWSTTAWLGPLEVTYVTFP